MPFTGPNRSLGLQEIEDPRISRQSTHEGGKVFSPTHWPPLPSKRYRWYAFLLAAESTPITLSGIEPATFRLVTQYLNHPRPLTQSVFVCSVYISEQTAITFLYNIN
jgi:hypothetical protein